MAIPIFDSILSTLHKAIDWTLKTLPRPILFLIFFVFITLIGSFALPLVFNTMGTFCVDDVKYTNDFYDFPTNVATMFKVFGLPDDANTSLGEQAVELNCLNYVSNSTNTTIWYDGGFCTNCTRITTFSSLYTVGIYDGDNNFGNCGTDAYRIPEENKSYFQKVFCESIGDESLIGFGCEPPEGFYYDLETHTYICHDIDTCGNVTELVFFQNSLLKKDFDREPASNSDNPKVVGIKCFANTPKLAVAGIDVLNPVMWLLLLFLIILLWSAFKFNLI